MRSTIAAGRVFGVPLRVHSSWLLLLALSVGLSAMQSGNLMRGLALWLALVFAVLTREAARAVVALGSGLRVRALLLFPVGGVLALSAADRSGHQPSARRLALAGSLANFLTAVLLLGFGYGFDPGVRLAQQPLIEPAHVLRSIIWLQVAIGAVNLLPSGVLPMRQVAKAQATPSQPAASPLAGGFGGPLRSLTSPAGLLGIVFLAGGLLFMSLPLILLGAFALLGAQIASPVAQAEAAAAGGHALRVEQVMLTEYTTLGGSDTLRSALERTTHSTQEVFPVLRGDQLVGSITRRLLMARLATEGDSYLQGIMTRNLQFADPREPLTDALRRSASFGGGDFIPVATEDGAVVGLLTPTSLEQAVGTVRLLTGFAAAQDAQNG